MDVLSCTATARRCSGPTSTCPPGSGGGARVGRVVLAAFNSLDDTVTIDDLADAMETRVLALEAASQFTVAGSAVICHSTGALVARRWLLNRLAAGAPIPSHFVTMAGANHGSSLAQMGKSVLGYVQKLLVKHLPTVGAAVLTDLDYGSDFLLGSIGNGSNGGTMGRSTDSSPSAWAGTTSASTRRCKCFGRRTSPARTTRCASAART